MSRQGSGIESDMAHANLSVAAKVEMVKIQLTTDTVNQIVFAQSKFITELNELFQVFFANPKQPKAPHQKPAKAVTPTVKHKFAAEVTMQGVHLSACSDSGTTVYFDSRVFTIEAANRFEDETHLIGVRASLTPVLWFGTMDHGQLPDDVEQDISMAYFKTRLEIKVDHALQGFCNMLHPDFSGQLKTMGRLTVQEPTCYVPVASIQKMIIFSLECKQAFHLWQKEQQAMSVVQRERTKQFYHNINQRLPSRPNKSSTESVFIHILVKDFVARTPLQKRTHTGASRRRERGVTYLVRFAWLCVTC